MITDDVMDAIDRMIERCEDDDERRGMLKLQDMLADWDSVRWMKMSVDQEKAFVDNYL